MTIGTYLKFLPKILVFDFSRNEIIFNKGYKYINYDTSKLTFLVSIIGKN